MFDWTSVGKDSAKRTTYAKICVFLTLIMMVCTVAMIDDAEDLDASTIIKGTGTTKDVNWTLYSDGVLTLGARASSAPVYLDWNYCGINVTTVEMTSSVRSIPDNFITSGPTITSITIGPNVKTIGDNAFKSTAIKTLTIPRNVTSLGTDSFGQSLELTKVTIDGDPVFTGNAFNGCTSLKEFKGNSKAIYNSTLLVYNGTLISYAAGCDNTKVTIPSTVTTIGESAFNLCPKLETITIPEGVVTIGKMAFNMCERLKSVTISNTVQTIGERAFGSCKVLSSVYFGNHVTTIESSAFTYCDLKSLALPESLVTISSSAFYGCTSISTIKIPSQVQNIGNMAFSGIYSLTKFTVDSKNKYFAAKDGVLYSKDLTTLVAYPSSKADSKFTIPNTVVKTSDYSFCWAKNLQEVTIPGSMSSIGYGTFAYCSKLSKVDMSDDGFTSIGNMAFYECPKLSYIHFSNNLTVSYSNAFPGFTFLDMSGKTVSKIAIYLRGKTFTGSEMVLHTGSAEQGGVQVSFSSGQLTINGNGTLNNDYPDETKTPWYQYKNQISQITIGQGITSIGPRVFTDMPNLVSISLPASLKSVDPQFYHNCDRLSTFGIGSGNETFTSYSNVLFTKDMTELIKYPSNRQGKEYTIPSAVKNIWDYAFENTYLLEKFHAFNSHLVEMGNYAFLNSGLSVIELPEGLKHLGYDVFKDCEQVSWINIPTTLSDFDDNSFESLLNLIKVPYGAPDMLGTVFVNRNGSLYPTSGSIGGITWSIDGEVLTIDGDGKLPNYISSQIDRIPWYAAMDTVTTLVIKGDITAIGTYDFQSFKKGIYKLELPSDLKRIESRAFGTLYVPVLEFPSSMEYIAANAFTNRFYNSNGQVLTVSAEELSGFTFTLKNGKYYRDSMPEYTVTYDIEGYRFQETVKHGATLVLPDIEPMKTTSDGKKYEFAGWKGYTAGMKVTSNILLTATFTAVNVYTVVIEYNDGTSETVKVPCNGKMSDVCSVSDYYLDEDHTMPWSPDRNVTRDLVLYAIVCKTGSIDNIDWFLELDSGILTITGNGSMPVFQKNSSAPWYKYRGDITEIVIGGKVTTITTNSFYGYTHVKTIVIGDNVTAIEKYAFKNCNGLQTLRVGNGLVSLNSAAFNNQFKGFEGESIKITQENFIGKQFEMVNGYLTMTSMVGSTGEVTWILNCNTGTMTITGNGRMADYYSCALTPWYKYRSSIEHVVLENGVTSLGDNTFYSFGRLGTVEISDTVTYIGKNSIRGCNQLYEINFGKGITTLGSNALYGYVFYDTDHNEIKIDAGSIRGKHFEGYSKAFVENPPYDIDSTSTIGIEVNGHLYTHIAYNGEHIEPPFFMNRIESGDRYTVQIGWNASYSEKNYDVMFRAELDTVLYKDLMISGKIENIIVWTVDVENRTLTVAPSTGKTNVDIPSWDSASETPWYEYSEYIDILVIGQGIVNIGMNSFRGLDYLYNITLPDSVVSIGKYAFYLDCSIETIKVGKNLSSVGTNAFKGFTFKLDDGTSMPLEALKGTTLTGTNKVLCCDSLKGTIGSSTWEYSSHVLYIQGNIPDYATTTDSPWNGLKNMVTSIVFSGTWSIGSMAFYDFAYVKTLNLTAVEYIGDYAFKGCDSLERVSFGTSLKSIGTHTFKQVFATPAGNKLTLSADKLAGKEFTLNGDKMVNTTVRGFYGNLTWVLDISSGRLTFSGKGDMINETSVTNYPWYQYRDYVKTVVVNSNVTSIGDYAFYSYDSITKVIVGKDVHYIGINNFRGCTNIKEIDFNSTSFTLGSKAFFNFTFT
ncbi:MAG: leucine-rich repeat domain-containing protein, partial [archaeon]|nr:leucine-rich repeat domain-containing protein [archaeon]